MPASANEWIPNAQRWGGQVGLPSDLPVEEINKRSSDVKVDGIDGKLADFIELDSDLELGILAIMVKNQDSAWFVKIMGDKNLVDQSRDDFDKFVKSIRFNK